MPVPTHFRFTARGVFAGTPEAWSFGLHMKRKLTGVADVPLENIDEGAVTAAFAGFFATAIGSTTDMQDWRAYVIGTNGKMEGNPLIVDVVDDAIGGGSSPVFPPQIALAVTLVGADRGPARFGRFYIPGPTSAIGGDLRISDTAAAAYRESATALLKGVADAIDEGISTEDIGAVNVSSRGGPSGTIQNVHHLEVGRAYDTLRSRRRSLDEARNVGGAIDW
jgi:hypothetical protein